ncbi:MAG TPA: transporter substrate-binding domain-containing protein [Erysipelothrix sp.]
MKKILVMLSTLLLITACSKSVTSLDEIKQEGKLTVAVSPDYAPYEFLDISKTGQDQYVGADIELAKFIAQELDLELELKSMDFADIPSAINLGKFHLGISGFTYSEERAEQILFSDAYDNSESTCQGFLVQKERNNDFSSMNDFADKTIAMQNGSLQQTYANAQLPEANHRLINKLDDAILELKYGKVDAVAISCESAKSFMLNNEDIILSDVKFDVIDEEGMMVIMAKEQTDLQQAVNDAIAKVKAEGLYVQWMAEANKLAEEIGAMD